MNAEAAQLDQLRAQLQDAHLIIGEQTVALRRYQLAVAQLQHQLERSDAESEIESTAT